MATFCPNCKGLMRPRKGVLECLHCSDEGRARTVMARGKRIHLRHGQSSLEGARAARSSTVDPPLQPKRPDWRPHQSGGTPDAHLGLFPHETIRSGQKRLTRDVTMAVRGGRHLVAQAPTGIGKTAAALAPALQDAIDHGRTVLFLTGRQSQHRIAVQTLRLIQETRGARFTLVDLVAKRDMCLRPEAQDMHPSRFPDFCASETRNRSCRFLRDVDDDTLQRVRDGVLHVEELMQVGKETTICPHLLAMTASQEAHVVVADYNHLFSDIRERSLERLGLDLSDITLVVDEAHNLPGRIRQNHAHRITGFLLDQVEADARTHRARGVLADLKALRAALDALSEQAVKEDRAEASRLDDAQRRVARLGIEELHDAFERTRNQGTLSGHRTLRDTIQDLTALAKQVRKGSDEVPHAEALQRALEDWGRFRKGALRYLEWDDDAVSLHIRLLDPAVVARDVFAAVHASVLMSGTLRPQEVLRDVLGLDDGRTRLRDYPSPFPKENRITAVAQGVSTRFKDRSPAQWARMAGIIAKACRAADGNIAVFAPSYAILSDLRIALEEEETGKEWVQEDPEMGKAERAQVLDQLAGARNRGGALLLGVLGGSFSEGVDFKDNLLSAVVVVGLPLAPPDLQTEATIGHYEAQFPGKGRLYAYIVPAMQKALQAMGRGIRSADDHCVVLLLDERYRLQPYRSFLGDVVTTDDPGGIAARFLQAHGL